MNVCFLYNLYQPSIFSFFISFLPFKKGNSREQRNALGRLPRTWHAHHRQTTAVHRGRIQVYASASTLRYRHCDAISTVIVFSFSLSARLFPGKLKTHKVRELIEKSLLLSSMCDKCNEMRKYWIKQVHLERYRYKETIIHTESEGKGGMYTGNRILYRNQSNVVKQVCLTGNT